MRMLSELEMVLLRLVQQGGGRWGWYQLASRLSRLDVPREPDMMARLKALVEDGYLVRHTSPGSPNDRWELTEAGREALRQKPES